jgi:hypothetical protein
MQSYKPRRRTTQILVQELPDEVLVYDMERNEVHCLNGSAARVWTHCDGESTVAEIARLVAPELEAATGESLVWCALDQFTERHLLEESADEPEKVEGPSHLTRRQMAQMVGRVSLAVGLAVPLVESIVSPPAVLAQSGCCGTSGPSACQV